MLLVFDYLGSFALIVSACYCWLVCVEMVVLLLCGLGWDFAVVRFRLLVSVGLWFVLSCW